MPQDFLIFDFGSKEDAAQHARHIVEGWRQGFRLDRKLLLKFDRQEPEAVAAEAANGADDKKGKAKTKASHEKTEKESEPHILLVVRLDFSDHERLSHQRWLERIPGEVAFKDAKPKVVRHGDADFDATAEKFDALP